MQGVLVCVGVYFGLVLGEVGRNCKDFGAGFGCEEGDGEIRLVWGRHVEGLHGRVSGFVYCEDGAPGATLGMLVVEGGIVVWFVI